jgi:hypothetical protein
LLPLLFMVSWTISFMILGSLSLMVSCTIWLIISRLGSILWHYVT